MHLRIDALFDHDHDLELPEPDLDPAGMEALLLSAAAAGAPHAEDALLGGFARFLAARGASAEQRRAGIELARDAIDQLGDAEGPWQALSIERWLRDAAARSRPAHDAETLVQRARDFVSFLGDTGRASLHGQRLLTRAVAAVRFDVNAGTGAAPDPRLAA